MSEYNLKFCGSTGRGPSGGSQLPTSLLTFEPGPIRDGKSNAFELSIMPGKIAYRYDVEIVKVGDGQRPDKSITKQNDPGLRTIQKECCADIIEALHGLTNGFEKNTHYVYDGKNLLFTTHKVKPINDQEVKPTDMKPRAAMFVRNSNVRVSITPNEKSSTIEYSKLDPALVHDATGQADHSTRMFLELATTQFVCNTDVYQRVSAGTVFENREFDLADGMNIRVGVKKGVRVTAHNNETKAYLFAEMKKTAFFTTSLLHDVYKKMVHCPAGRANFVRFFHGVRMYVHYDPSRTFIFDKLSERNVGDKMYRVNGQSLPDFFRTHRNVELVTVNLPGVHPRQTAAGGGNVIVYPLDVIRPVPGQLVPVEKLTDNAIRRLLLENAVAPHVRMNYIIQHVRQIGEREGGEFLENFGLKLKLDSNDIKITTSAIPNITVGQNRTVRPQANGSWFRDAVESHFLEGSSKLRTWMVAYDRKVNPAEAHNFVRSLINAGSRSGMTLPEPSSYLATDVNEMEQIFVHAKERKIQYILYTDDISIKSHGKLKLLEAYHKILTQHVASKNLRADDQTIKNVLMKMNVKCFGLNYMPVFDELSKEFSPACKDLLIIGYDMATPPTATPRERYELRQAGSKAENRKPAVVGVCANRLKNNGFAGDFFYQESRGDMVSPNGLEAAVKQATKAACLNGRRPLRVLVLRGGVSEGRQENVHTHELLAIRSGIKAGLQAHESSQSLQPKITLVVATKKHFKRFFRNRKNGGPLKNTCPGNIINSKVTRSDVPEFYAQAHHPLEGSPKIPQYAVLVNELKMTPIELEQTMIMLSNMHQVSACPTSLPLPVYLADETAKRGMEIFKAFEIYHREGFMNDVMQNELGIWDFELLSEKLGYHETELYETRFNA